MKNGSIVLLASIILFIISTPIAIIIHGSGDLEDIMAATSFPLFLIIPLFALSLYFSLRLISKGEGKKVIYKTPLRIFIIYLVLSLIFLAFVYINEYYNTCNNGEEFACLFLAYAPFLALAYLLISVLASFLIALGTYLFHKKN